MPTPLKKLPDPPSRRTSTRSMRANTPPVTSSRKFGSPLPAETMQTNPAQAEFLDALEESVKQANDGHLTPIEPLLDELWTKYGDGKDTGN